VKTARKLNIPFAVATPTGALDQPFQSHIVRSGLMAMFAGWTATTCRLVGDEAEATGQQQPRGAWIPSAPRSGCGGDIGTTLDAAPLRDRLGDQPAQRPARDVCRGPDVGRPLTFTVPEQRRQGLVRASQISIGHKNDLGLEIAGTKGSLTWRQEEPKR